MCGRQIDDSVLSVPFVTVARRTEAGGAAPVIRAVWLGGAEST